MKALILKDLYMAFKYCRMFLVITLCFSLAGMFMKDNLFFVIYPCLMASLIPNTLLAYDERCKWELYASSMPFTRAQLVSAKYIIGMIFQASAFLISTIAVIIRSVFFYHDAFMKIGAYMVGAIAAMLLTIAISLPVMFKFGVEKGRLYYYLIVVLLGGGTLAAGAVAGNVIERTSINVPPILLPLALVLPVGLYVLSWYLSVVFYKKRDF